MKNLLSGQSRLLQSLSTSLNSNEIDALKYRLSIAAANIMRNEGDTPQVSKEKFNSLLEGMVNIQAYRNRVSEYGLAYKERPDFITQEILEALIAESERFKSESYRNLDQYIYQVETPSNSTYAEKLASSSDLHKLVNKYAGKSLQSFVTSYLYYDSEDQCSRPHVDNAFTSITVMVGLKQTSKNGKSSNLSSSFIYWAHKPRLEYQLYPGEVAIFFGACVLHGRTRLKSGEITHSLLMSFRPMEV